MPDREKLVEFAPRLALAQRLERAEAEGRLMVCGRRESATDWCRRAGVNPFRVRLVCGPYQIQGNRLVCGPYQILVRGPYQILGIFGGVMVLVHGWRDVLPDADVEAKVRGAEVVGILAALSEEHLSDERVRPPL